LIILDPTGLQMGSGKQATGHAMAEPVTTLMKSGRRIAFPKTQEHANNIGDYSRDLLPAE
jgi:hypothetical protein